VDTVTYITQSLVISNFRGRDLGSFVAETRVKITGSIALPPGYFIEYSGQFENEDRATRRLEVIVPVVIAIIFILLYFTFGSAKDALLTLFLLPLLYEWTSRERHT
jgi:cobalt-zinc-cadmium resistance protein CzcA